MDLPGLYPGEDNKYLLCFACEYRLTDIVTILLKFKASANINGGEPLCNVLIGHSSRDYPNDPHVNEIVLTLLEAGADPKVSHTLAQEYGLNRLEKRLADCSETVQSVYKNIMA